MNIKLKDLRQAIEYFRYSARVEDNTSIEVSINEENIENSKLCSSITFSAKLTKEANPYESLKTQKDSEISVEIFSEEENRPARVTTQESRDLGD